MGKIVSCELRVVSCELSSKQTLVPEMNYILMILVVG